MKLLFFAFMITTTVQIASAGTIVVTIPDFKPIAESIAGNEFEVLALIPQASDPHAFTLSADDITTLRKADLIVLANSNFFEFEAKIAEEFTDLVDFEDYNVKLYDFPGYRQNLHGYWMLPENAIEIARAIKEKLVEKYPEKREIFDRNYHVFVDRVKEAAKEAKKITSNERGKKFVAMVPGVCYIARTFNITISAVIISEGSGIASGKEIAEIRNKLKSGEYRGIIVPEFMKNGKGEELARELVKNTNAKIAWVKFSQGDSAYDTMLISNAARIAYSSSESTSESKTLLYLLGILSVIEALIIVYLRVGM